MKGNWEMGLPLKQAVVLHRRIFCFLFPQSSLCIIVVELDASLLYLMVVSPKVFPVVATFVI
jgi:hypothetical protein